MFSRSWLDESEYTQLIYEVRSFAGYMLLIFLSAHVLCGFPSLAFLRLPLCSVYIIQETPRYTNIVRVYSRLFDTMMFGSVLSRQENARTSGCERKGFTNSSVSPESSFAYLLANSRYGNWPFALRGPSAILRVHKGAI